MIITGKELRRNLKNRSTTGNSFPRAGTERSVFTGWQSPGHADYYGFTYMDTDRIQLSNSMLRKNGWNTNDEQPLDLAQSLKVVDEFVHSGWNVTYDIIDQAENGYWDKVRNRPKEGMGGPEVPFTYTTYVKRPEMSEGEYVDGLLVAFESVADMYLYLAQTLPKLK